ncbi:hypothetical protein Xph01_34550 [Micromonospora phaseoli]|nr:hypothetical protein Xph01_34550 [Micromonospora phaseoli]
MWHGFLEAAWQFRFLLILAPLPGLHRDPKRFPRRVWRADPNAWMEIIPALLPHLLGLRLEALAAPGDMAGHAGRRLPEAAESCGGVGTGGRAAPSWECWGQAVSGRKT